MPSILSFTQPIVPRMPSVYYPGPMASDEGSESASSCLTRRIVLAITLAAIVILIIMIIYHMWRGPRLARGLTQNGWTVYLRKGCGFCDKQMEMLDGFGQYIRYGTDGVLISGYTNNPPLTFGVIKGFPCWYNLRTNEKVMGLQDLAALKKMAH